MKYHKIETPHLTAYPVADPESAAVLKRHHLLKTISEERRVDGENMTLEQCKTCKYHEAFDHGAVWCSFDQNVASITVVLNPKIEVEMLSMCPREW